VNVVLKGRIARYLQDCGYTPEAATREAAKYSGHSGRVGIRPGAADAGPPRDSCEMAHLTRRQRRVRAPAVEVARDPRTRLGHGVTATLVSV